MSFLVSDREIENEDYELHFWVHSADKDKMVYWMPGKSGKFYALPYKHEGNYLAQGPMRKELRPDVDEDDEDEEEEEKKSFYVIHEDADPEAAREKQYRDIVAGKSSESKFGPSSSGTTGSKSSSGGSKFSPGSGSKRLPSKPSRKDMSQLTEALKKIPRKEQEKLKKELRGMLQGKKK